MTDYNDIFIKLGNIEARIDMLDKAHDEQKEAIQDTRVRIQRIDRELGRMTGMGIVVGFIVPLLLAAYIAFLSSQQTAKIMDLQNLNRVEIERLENLVQEQ